MNTSNIAIILEFRRQFWFSVVYMIKENKCKLLYCGYLSLSWQMLVDVWKNTLFVLDSYQKIPIERVLQMLCWLSWPSMPDLALHEAVLTWPGLRTKARPPEQGIKQLPHWTCQTPKKFQQHSAKKSQKTKCSGRHICPSSIILVQQLSLSWSPPCQLGHYKAVAGDTGPYSEATTRFSK